MSRPLRTAALLAITALTATLLSAAPASSGAAARGVDITPPEVGTCHELTFDQAWKASDPRPAVPCGTRHTTVTVKVLQFDSPNWEDEDWYYRATYVGCINAVRNFLGAGVKPFMMSAYGLWIFRPTAAQRDAGATWVRCDVALWAGTDLQVLAGGGRPPLGELPLPDDVARCRAGDGRNYFMTTCVRHHMARATHAVKYPGDRYPGVRRIKRWTIRRCGRLARTSYWVFPPSRIAWKVGLRYSICEERSRN